MLFDTPFVTLPVNDRGRDFCVGDLHGCLSMLEELLEAAEFDRQRDRLFSVGDLVHRGPDSAACLCLAEEPWFYPVMGNHEAMQIAAYAGAYWVEDAKLETGLEYLADADPRTIAREHERYQVILDRLPLAIETTLADGRRVGIVHAGLRSPYCWADVQAIYRRDAELDRPRVALQPLLLWDRLPADLAFAICFPRMQVLQPKPGGTPDHFDQPGDIDLLVTGHCRVPDNRPLRIGRNMFLDTGAGFLDGWLSMVELSSGRCWQASDSRVLPGMPVRKLDRYPEHPVDSLPVKSGFSGFTEALRYAGFH